MAIVNTRKENSAIVRSIIKSKAERLMIPFPKLISKADISCSTFYSRLRNSDDIRLEELRRLDKILKFSDDELLEIVRGVDYAKR